MARGRDFGILRSALFIGLGVLLMYWLNVLRIAGIALIGMALTRWVGAAQSAYWAGWFFHGALSWTLYAVFLLLYLKAWSMQLQPGTTKEAAYGM